MISFPESRDVVGRWLRLAERVDERTHDVHGQRQARGAQVLGVAPRAHDDRVVGAQLVDGPRLPRVGERPREGRVEVEHLRHAGAPAPRAAHADLLEVVDVERVRAAHALGRGLHRLGGALLVGVEGAPRLLGRLLVRRERRFVEQAPQVLLGDRVALLLLG